MKNYFILINPTAGKRNNSKKIKAIKSFFAHSQIPHSIFFTTAHVRADQLVRNHFGKEFTHLVVAGGDGTLNEVVNGLNNFDKPLGIIPMGSGNDFVKNLSLGTNWEYLVGDRLVHVTIGTFNERRFLNGIGAGFDGQIVYNMKNKKTLLRGHFAYLYHVIKILGTYKENLVHFSIDGESYSEKLLLILAANGTTFGGGFKLAPQAEVQSDTLDLCIIKKVAPWRRFLYLNRLKKGNHGKMEEVSFFKAKNIRIEANQLHGQVDGEYAGTPPYSIGLYPDKLKILVSDIKFDQI